MREYITISSGKRVLLKLATTFALCKETVLSEHGIETLFEWREER